MGKLILWDMSRTLEKSPSFTILNWTSPMSLYAVLLLNLEISEKKYERTIVLPIRRDKTYVGVTDNPARTLMKNISLFAETMYGVIEL